MNDKNLFSIGEVAKAVGITRKTILNYETKGLITRTKRKRLITHEEENRLRLTGIFRNIYLEGPPQLKDKSNFITQIIAIVE